MIMRQVLKLRRVFFLSVFRFEEILQFFLKAVDNKLLCSLSDRLVAPKLAFAATFYIGAWNRFPLSWASLQTDGPCSVASVCPVGLTAGYCTLNTFKGRHSGGQLYQVPELPEAMFVTVEEQIPKSSQDPWAHYGQWGHIIHYRL